MLKFFLIDNKVEHKCLPLASISNLHQYLLERADLTYAPDLTHLYWYKLKRLAMDKYSKLYGFDISSQYYFHKIVTDIEVK